VCAEVCGDAILTASEGCDDGGVVPGDGCDGSCQIEAGWGCVGAPSICTATCGDTLVIGPEECDDGGTLPGDGCSAMCRIEDEIPVHGVAQGGLVEVTVDGVVIWVVTSDAQTAAEIAAALAAAIEADPTLSSQGVTAIALDGLLVTDGSIAGSASTDPGIAFGEGSRPLAGPSLPLGAIVAWHRDLTDTPVLPEGWAEADGTVLSDLGSPLDGVLLPDWNGEGRFLRGAATPGVPQPDAFQGHSHSPTTNGTTFDGNTPHFLGWGINPIADDCPAWIEVREPISDGVNGTPRFGAETRPVNMSVVWIVKVRANAGPPVGAIVAWHRDLANTPLLASGWVPANGQVLNDPLSPYGGVDPETMPDLNATGRFLRGGASSGATQEDRFQGHWHEVDPGHAVAYVAPGGPWRSGGSDDDTPIGLSVGGPVAYGGYGSPRYGGETRPVNMSVVWIVKVRSGARVPVGSVVGWHSGLAGVPELSTLWTPADGQPVFVGGSPYQGRSLPDLNGAGLFLRGGTSSGVHQPDEIQGHHHAVYTNGERVEGGSALGSPTGNFITQYFVGWNVLGPITDDGNGTPRLDTETRPVNASVVWIVATSPSEYAISTLPWIWAVLLGLGLTTAAWWMTKRDATSRHAPPSSRSVRLPGTP
jgi:cysteine-rich repeat protein